MGGRKEDQILTEQTETTQKDHLRGNTNIPMKTIGLLSGTSWSSTIEYYMT